MDRRLYKLSEEHFDKVIELSDSIFGKGFFSREDLQKALEASTIGHWCCSSIMYDGDKSKGNITGFRITAAPGKWDPHNGYYTPEDWGVEDIAKVCHFRTIAINPNYRRHGIATTLLNISIETVQKMGAVAGVAHVWKESPKNGAFRYFADNGGKIVAVWLDRWTDVGSLDQGCLICGEGQCHCTGLEMIIHFGETSNE